jgi:ABC-type molybdenum transport system ATPase subunit/photorepair protein PhrA
MMELRHLTMVNWHLFDIEDIEVGGHIGVLGENRSGKSTVLDMAQVVLTGANRNFMRLNAVAGDGAAGRTGSPKRNVAGHCLGALGEEEMRRQEARTYVALGFEDSEGVRPALSIGLALEARTSESSETVLARFVVIGKILRPRTLSRFATIDAIRPPGTTCVPTSSPLLAKMPLPTTATGPPTTCASTCAI